MYRCQGLCQMFLFHTYAVYFIFPIGIYILGNDWMQNSMSVLEQLFNISSMVFMQELIIGLIFLWERWLLNFFFLWLLHFKTWINCHKQEGKDGSFFTFRIPTAPHVKYSRAENTVLWKHIEKNLCESCSLLSYTLKLLSKPALPSLVAIANYVASLCFFSKRRKKVWLFLRVNEKDWKVT